MKIAIMGAGAVGCYYGALLALAGHEVVLIGRPRLVEAAAAQGGVLLERQSGTQLVPVAASSDPAAVEGARIVLFCVKSGDTEDAGQVMAPYLSADCAILSLQNGVDNAERLAALLGREVIACVVYVAAEMAGAAHVLHHGRGELVIADSEDGRAASHVLGEAGIATELSGDVRGALWTKLIHNCAYNAISAIAQLSYGELVRGEGVPALIDDVVEECLAVAARLGVAIPDAIRQSVAGVPLTIPGQRSSTAQDLARGKPSEIDHLNGHIVREGRRHGIATPANNALYALVRLVEESGRVRAG